MADRRRPAPRRPLLLAPLLLGLAAPLLGAGAAQDAGPVPAAVRLEPVAANPVLAPGPNGAWDAVSVRFPHALRHDGRFHLFYASFRDRAAPTAIGYAVSDDGERWTKAAANPVLEGDGDGFDAFGVSMPVVWVETDGTWTMLYGGLAEPGQVFGRAIGRATAPAPEGPWTRDAGPVLEVGPDGAWDGRFLFPSAVVRTGEGLALYYSAGLALGRATSTDGLRWTKHDDSATGDRYAESDPVLTAGDGWDAAMAWGASVRAVPGGGFELFYYGLRDTNRDLSAIGYATSADGVRWRRWGDGPVLAEDGRQTFFPSVVVTEDGGYWLYYASASGTPTEIRLARGRVER